MPVAAKILAAVASRRPGGNVHFVPTAGAVRVAVGCMNLRLRFMVLSAATGKVNERPRQAEGRGSSRQDRQEDSDRTAFSPRPFNLARNVAGSAHPGRPPILAIFRTSGSVEAPGSAATAGSSAPGPGCRRGPDRPVAARSGAWSGPSDTAGIAGRKATVRQILRPVGNHHEKAGGIEEFQSPEIQQGREVTRTLPRR